MFTAEILSVGNELLIGKTTNTNLTWLSGQLTNIGGVVRRALTVRDEIGEIAEALALILQHRPDLIIISGGLGPTFDDKTLQGLAHGLGRFLYLDDWALRLIKASVKDLNPARLKMAHIPKGGRALSNLKGTAPGVYLSVGQAHIFALPGVPLEMRSIFRNSIVGFLQKTFALGSLHEASLSVVGLPESKIAPYIDEGIARFPEVYIKSHPLGVEDGRPRINLHLTSQTNSEAVKEAAAMLTEKIRRNRGVVVAS